MTVKGRPSSWIGLGIPTIVLGTLVSLVGMVQVGLAGACDGCSDALAGDAFVLAALPGSGAHLEIEKPAQPTSAVGIAPMPGGAPIVWAGGS